MLSQRAGDEGRPGAAESRGWSRTASVRYKVVVHPSEEGFAVSCLGVPVCWSQGVTEAEAQENIEDAIREYLGAVDDLIGDEPGVRLIEIAA